MDKQKKSFDGFSEHELIANIYVANCLAVVAALAALIWVLNSVGFFTIDHLTMNVSICAGMFFLLIPSVLIKFFKLNTAGIMKYFNITCFVIGIAIIYTGCTYQAILAWACPIVLSCHYYSRRFTSYTLVCTLVFMLIAMNTGIYFGAWDYNIMDDNTVLQGYSLRKAFIESQLANGTDIISRAFNFYYIPRALICVMVYSICITLSRRTHTLIAVNEQSVVENEKISTELGIAATIQKSMLPTHFVDSPEKVGYDICATMMPSKDVIGDFYDFFPVDEDHLALVIADVSGNGVHAAMFMMAAKIMIKTKLQSGHSPSKTAYDVNNQLCAMNDNDMFVSAWLAVYEISTGKITACNAGHEYPFHRKDGKDFLLIRDKHCLVLGGMANVQYSDYEFSMDKGDTLFIYTDGIMDTLDTSGQRYGSDRLSRRLTELRNLEIRDILDVLKEDIDNFADGAEQSDDLTMLVIKRY